MSRVVNATVAGLVALVLLSGAVLYLLSIRGGDDVEAGRVALEWEGADGQETRMVGLVTVENDREAPVRLERAEYAFWMAGLRFDRNATDTLDFSVSPGGDATVDLPIAFATDDVYAWWRAHVASEESSAVTFAGRLVFATDEGERDIEFNHTQEIRTRVLESLRPLENCPASNEPCLDSVDVGWTVDASGPALQLDADIRNTMHNPITVSNRSAALQLHGTAVGSDRVDDSTTIEGNGQTVFPFRLAMTPADVTAWWIQHVDACESSRITLEVAFDTSSRGGDGGGPPGGGMAFGQHSDSGQRVEWTLEAGSLTTGIACDAGL